VKLIKEPHGVKRKRARHARARARSELWYRAMVAGGRPLSFARVILQIVIEFETIAHSESFVKEMNGPRNDFFCGGRARIPSASAGGTKCKLIGSVYRSLRAIIAYLRDVSQKWRKIAVNLS